MSDALVNLARNSTARAVVKTLGLPIPMPRTLDRATGPWEERPLKDRDVVVMHPDGTEFEVIDADPRRIKRLRVRFSDRDAIK